jgi:hypothetical protein
VVGQGQDRADAVSLPEEVGAHVFCEVQQ